MTRSAMTKAQEQAKRTAARQVLWHSGDRRGLEPGSFIQKLLDAWVKADLMNDARLRAGFPVLGEAVNVARTEGVDALATWGGLDG